MASSTKFERPKVEVGRSPTRCPYCHENLNPAEDVWVVCTDCLARHHKECWQDSARCCSCGQTGFLEPAGMTVFRGQPKTDRITKPGEVPTLVVDKKGGDFATIGDAIRAAKPGTKIVIAAGTYHEGIVIDKPLALVGRGRTSEVVIESNGSDCVVMETDQAMVRGVTLRARTGLNHAAHAVVTVMRGVLRLWDCDVSSDSLWPCIFVSGQGQPLVRRCKIHGGLGGAVLVSEHGGGTFEDCEIHGVRQYGIAVKTGARPTFERCQVHHVATGIFADESGRGSFKDCEVWSATDAGVRITQGAHPVLGRCKIHDCRDGVTVHDSGEGTFDECTVTACQRSNVLVERGGHPVFTRSRIDKSQGTGVTVSSAGHGRFDDCTISENEGPGVEILLGGDPTLERTKIRRNRGAAVRVRQNGRGTIEGCDLTQNEGGPWLVEGKCGLARRGNREI